MPTNKTEILNALKSQRENIMDLFALVQVIGETSDKPECCKMTLKCISAMARESNDLYRMVKNLEKKK